MLLWEKMDVKISNLRLYLFNNNMHLVSPLVYIIFVDSFKFLQPCPQSKIMLSIRCIHNITLSILSLMMLIGISIANYQTNKYNTLNCLLCKQYESNWYLDISTKTFLYSKYMEWFDTLFLHLSGKEISTLHYTHHMSTAFLMYMNMIDYISPSIFVCVWLNCFVHIFMYLYFAYPKGFLFKYRKYITQFQILQHVICLITIFYTNNLKNCNQNKFGNLSGLLGYLIYLFYFLMFYFKSYFSYKKN